VSRPDAVAAEHYRRQAALARRASEEAGRIWGELDRAAIAASWLSLTTSVMTVLTSAQAIAAAAAGPYLDAILAAIGLRPGSQGTVNVSAFSGTASDGRDLETLLYQPAIKTLAAIQSGAPIQKAMTLGRLDLDMIVRTQVADAGRVADGVALTARPQLTGYVRMLSPPSCDRCIVLAGRKYRWNQGFQRHPRCDCRHIPVAEDADDVRTDPKKLFESLSEAEQNRIFTVAGAQAIRDGADMNRVVNARRGMYTAGGRKFTTEATTGRRVRLMPEQIYAEANGNRDEALRLLRLHGYIL
jgi:hypothetical protein